MLVRHSSNDQSSGAGGDGERTRLGAGTITTNNKVVGNGLPEISTASKNSTTLLTLSATKLITGK